MWKCGAIKKQGREKREVDCVRGSTGDDESSELIQLEIGESLEMVSVSEDSRKQKTI